MLCIWLQNRNDPQRPGSASFVSATCGFGVWKIQVVASSERSTTGFFFLLVDGAILQEPTSEQFFRRSLKTLLCEPAPCAS